MTFFKSFIRSLLDEGHTVDIATNEEKYKVVDCFREWGCNVFHVSWKRTPLSLGNVRAIFDIRKLVTSKEYDIVHCHTPIASVCTRLACKDLRRNGVKVIYTAHGFHFYRGAPLQNWALFYPIEKICARYTDIIITINNEDYVLAKRRMKAKRVEYVPGVGIDTEMFRNATVDRGQKRKEIGVPENVFLVLSVGELNKNKNHQSVIRAVASLSNLNIHYAIAGEGDQRAALEKLAADTKVFDRIHLLGYRNDVAELYKAADIFALPSIREGLNVSVMEAMASGLPSIISRIRGNVDLIDDSTGYLVETSNVEDIINGILDILSGTIKSDNCILSAQKYSKDKINTILYRYYLEIINE